MAERVPLRPQLLYRLIYARLPNEAELTVASNARLDELACVLLASREFQVLTAEPALDGCYVDPGGRLDRADQAELEAAFGLAAGLRLRRLLLLARVIESEALAPGLAAADVPWSAAGLGQALRRAAGRSLPLPSRDSDLRSPFDQVARNVTIVALSGIGASENPGEVRLDEGLRFVLFKLDARVCAGSDFCRIDFGLTLDRTPFGTTLAIDYGAGFERRHVIELHPRGRSRYAAFLASPQSIQMLRWDIGPAGMARPTLLAARPLSSDRVTHAIRRVAGERALAWLRGAPLPVLRPAAPEIPAFRQSEWLSVELGGHRDRPGYTDWLRLRALVVSDEAVSKRFLGVYPSFDLIIVVDAEDATLVADTIGAVRRQSYAQWSLLIAVLGGAGRARRLARGVDDDRISFVPSSDDRSLSGALSAALARCKGDWISTLRPGDLLAPEALARVASFVERTPSLRFVYADHDHLDKTGRRCDPAFKPDFSPETLLGHDYIEEPAFIRSRDLRSVGGWRDLPKAAIDHDLKLRILERLRPEWVGHLAEVLLHMRPHDVRGEGKGEAMSSAARRVVQERLAHRGLAAEVEEAAPAGLRIRHALPPELLVSLIIPTRDRADLLKTCIDSVLEHAGDQAFEIIVVDNDSSEPATLALFESWRDEARIRIIPYDRPFNFSAINNFAVTHARGEVVGFLNNDIEVVTSGWMEELAGWALQHEIGCVGAKLVYPDGRIQHGGVIIGIGGVAAHSHKYAPRASAGYGRRLSLVQNVSAVTAACLFVRRATFEAVGGFEESLAVAFNDVDFCLKVLDAGFRNLMCPFAELIHHESSSRGADDEAEKSARFHREIAFMQDKWGPRLRLDPFYSPNLTQAQEDFDFNWAMRAPRAAAGVEPNRTLREADGPPSAQRLF